MILGEWEKREKEKACQRQTLSGEKLISCLITMLRAAAKADDCSPVRSERSKRKASFLLTER